MWSLSFIAEGVACKRSRIFIPRRVQIFKPLVIRRLGDYKFNVVDEKEG